MIEQRINVCVLNSNVCLVISKLQKQYKIHIHIISKQMTKNDNRNLILKEGEVHLKIIIEVVLSASSRSANGIHLLFP